ncbi:hypothetical protein LCGC14_3062280 [marine sediment metagenome]|uniref:Uncharacterized protein n=1 Tax=marine sediment metagenome TaxID=412755 RepID=A0A0F8WJ25_9ZZZZ
MSKPDGVMGEARRVWKKAHPGITGGIHIMVEKSFDAGFQSAEGICLDDIERMRALAHLWFEGGRPVNKDQLDAFCSIGPAPVAEEQSE